MNRGTVVWWLLLLLIPAVGWSAASLPTGENATATFLQRHWARPLAPQGSPPASFSPQETSLDPEVCGQCHAAQYEAWKTSLHSRAMGPGLLGQLLAMSAKAREDHQACLRCHAPLAEQAESLVVALSEKKHVSVSSVSHLSGLTCAGCHVRHYQRFGPPARGGKPSPEAPHGGWVASAAFDDSRFCATCHQFAEDDPALNGKLLENTYREWRESRYSREGRHCQSCHMPDRRHLWRGIHDPAMVREGVTLTTEPLVASPGEVAFRLVLRNTGVGHYFPTYVTPRVIIEAWQRDEQGKVLDESRVEKVIARDVPLDLSQEISDTRVPPDGAAVLEYRRPCHLRAVTLVWRVRVEPDAFYLRFYRALLENGMRSEEASPLQQAARQAEESAYTLFSGQHMIWRADF